MGWGWLWPLLHPAASISEKTASATTAGASDDGLSAIYITSVAWTAHFDRLRASARPAHRSPSRQLFCQHQRSQPLRRIIRARLLMLLLLLMLGSLTVRRDEHVCDNQYVVRMTSHAR